MPSRTIKGAGFSQDILIFLRLLSRHRVRYPVVGGEAVIFHGYPHVTGAAPSAVLHRDHLAQTSRSTFLTLSKCVSRLTIGSRCCRASAAIHASFAGIGVPLALSSDRISA